MGSLEPVEQIARTIATVLSRQPSGLFTDIDGTISRVAPTPSEAIVDDRSRAVLRHLATQVTVVGVITGRGASDADRMLGLPGPIVIGNHGYEQLARGERFIHPSAIGSRASIAAVARLLGDLVSSSPRLAGVVIEDKELSASVHYRLVEDQGETIDLLRGIVDGVAGLHDLRVTGGKFVFEIRPKAVVDKGTAIHDLAIQHGLTGVVYLGDDLTDVDAFTALRTLRTPDIATVSVGVVSPETHAAVRETADYLVAGVDGCIELLERVSTILDREQGR